MNFICRSCAKHAQVAATSTKTATRHFSSTHPSHSLKHVPSFPPSSSPELDSLLLALRTTHLLPTHLTTAQQRLIYRSRHRSRLENNPTSLTIGDETFPLQPLDRNTLASKRQALIRESITLLSSQDEWTQLPALLTALASLGRDVPLLQVERLVRLAASAGQMGPVVQVLRTAEWQALLGRSKGVRRAVVRGVRQSAEVGGWSKEALDRAVRYAEDVAVSLGAARVGRMEDDGVGDALLVAAWLEVYAVRAVKFGRGVGEVERYFARVAGCFDAEKLKHLLQKDDLDHNTEFMRLLALWQGVALAEKVLPASSPAFSSPKAEELHQYADSARERLAKTVDAIKARGSVAEGSYAGIAVKEYELAAANIANAQS